MKSIKRFTAFIAIVLCMTILFSVTANAAYYNTYTTVATLGNANSCYSTQAFAVGSSYAYSAKVNTDNTKAVLYRTTLSSGTTTLMTNGDTGGTYCTYLGHANDMTLMSHDGNYYMFIVTMNTGSLSLVKLRYSGTTHYKVGNFTIKLDGENKAMSGIAIFNKSTEQVAFLFKSGKNFYKGNIDLGANSGTINVTYRFKINVSTALVNGSTVSDIADYVTQGITKSGDKLYFPLTKDNVSIVLVYEDISTASGTIYAHNNLSFRITSSAYSDLFEIESVGIANDGKLWFNTNRRATPSDTTSDGVHYFNGYTA